MFPTLKNDPGVLLLEDSVTVPELSVADGSTQDTVIPPRLRPIWLVTSSMQLTRGAMSSTERQSFPFLLFKSVLKKYLDSKIGGAHRTLL